MGTSSDFDTEIKYWLKIGLKNENLKNLSISILGNSEKGDGYMGDIVFVVASGAAEDKSTKTFDLVLKCSKRSQALREATPVKEVFFNEIFMYERVLPYFIQFQKDKGIKDPFSSVPKCYGTFTGENTEVIILENLKSKGYELFPKKQPLSTKHIDLVVTEYGRYHATSLAVNLQQPVEFQEFVDSLMDTFKKNAEKGDFYTLFGRGIDESYELLKDKLDEDTLSRWKDLRNKIDFIFKDLPYQEGMKVIIHGDCWNNNFMYLHSDGNEKIPLKVKFLDWQIAKYASPLLDLSYFLFSAISKEDLDNLGDILDTYLKSFVRHLKELGIEDGEKLYPRNQFLAEWNNFCIYGILLASLLLKIVSTEKDEVLDVAELVDSGKSFTETFTGEIKDKGNYKTRIRPLIEYAVKQNLI